MKRTQAEKLKRVMMCGTLQYEGVSPDDTGKVIISFTPNEAGHAEKGIPYLEIECISPFELIDLILFEYLEAKRPSKSK